MRIATFEVFLLIILCACLSCNKGGTQQETTVGKVNSIQKRMNKTDALLSPPSWAKDATLYEVNLRQYTEEGTFKSFIPQIPRLKDMGIDILWFMPIYPISKEKRKGELGSYYAVQDYTAVNEEFGSLVEFREMVAAIHRAGMKIIIDFVPNHTGWDHAWITEHPEFFTKNSQGEITEPLDPNNGNSKGWSDVAELDYTNFQMRQALTDEMVWWLTDCDVDGFRMDIAYEVPNDFWDECIPTLMRTKKVFLLAEAEAPHLRNISGFAADYGWKLYHLMNGIAEGTKNTYDIAKWYQSDRSEYHRGYHINFTSNHDENSWSGTEFERLGEGSESFAVLAGTLDGMPLIYSGQEEPLMRRLKFFEKDFIGFRNFKNADFYRTLLNLKKKNKALYNGDFGGEAKFLETSNDKVIAYSRASQGDLIFVLINLSSSQQFIEMSTADIEGPFENVFGNSTTRLGPTSKFNLKPWDYLVLSRVGNEK